MDGQKVSIQGRKDSMNGLERPKNGQKVSIHTFEDSIHGLKQSIHGQIHIPSARENCPLRVPLPSQGERVAEGRVRGALGRQHKGYPSSAFGTFSPLRRGEGLSIFTIPSAREKAG